jgi:Icc-related predicted phosphoesterase
MLPNFPFFQRGGRQIDPLVERLKQEEWLADRQHPHRAMLGNPDAPIVCVRGNHDFIPAVDMFPGCDVREVTANEVHEVCGLRFTGHRGIPMIYGNWSDETVRSRLSEAVEAMELADVYVTHYPPGGVLDFDEISGVLGGSGSVVHFGLQGMAELLMERHAAGRAWHLFGHIHERGGRFETHGTVTFSNAATTFNVIEVGR